ncbi:selenide, water dikinase SelD [Deltaproteobacteria bacterium Smac51]|nr:selenide, water dikinase SelD [Deltaproteobacteria bacterium Smac51]
MNFLSTCTSGGCGAKIGPAELSEILHQLPLFQNKDLLVGFESSDDAAVWRLSPEAAVVSTVDFFPPMVDSPHLFGRIAAANAMSDIYAMGGQVLFALNLVCFPQHLDKEVLGQILLGGAEKVKEAGAVLCGGHSIYDHEPKYGLAVTGLVHPDKILRNNTCREGDCLILTKALGVGLIMSAVRAGAATDEEYQAAAASMERLNKYAAEKLSGFPVNAATDVTGFGLLVHASEMAGADKSLTINFDSLPILPGATKHAADYLATAAGQRNRNHIQGRVVLEGLTPAQEEILFDPQTSGGLLISLPAGRGEELCDLIRKDDPAAAIIGMVGGREDYSVMVL